MLNDAIQKENSGNSSVYYINKIKASRLLNASGVQFPGGKSISNGFVHSIHEIGSSVNTKYANIFETPQFKHWFGRSKVVNDDGTPKVFYHGTSSFPYIDTGENSEYNEGASYGGTFTDPKINAVLVFDSTDATIDSISKDIFKYRIRSDHHESGRETWKSFARSAKEQSYVESYIGDDYKAASKAQMGNNRARIPDVFHNFGYTGNYIIRDGVYYKDEGSVSGDTEVSYSLKRQKKNRLRSMHPDLRMSRFLLPILISV